MLLGHYIGFFFFDALPRPIIIAKEQNLVPPICAGASMDEAHGDATDLCHDATLPMVATPLPEGADAMPPLAEDPAAAGLRDAAPILRNSTAPIIGDEPPRGLLVDGLRSAMVMLVAQKPFDEETISTPAAAAFESSVEWKKSPLKAGFEASTEGALGRAGVTRPSRPPRKEWRFCAGRSPHPPYGFMSWRGGGAAERRRSYIDRLRENRPPLQEIAFDVRSQWTDYLLRP